MDDLISREITEEMVKEYCQKRCLVLITRELFEEMKARWSSAQPETPSYVAEIESEYKKWVSMPHINKPLAKALYEVWKKHDIEDVSRNG